MTDGQFRWPGRMDVALTGNVTDWAPSGIGNSTLVYIEPDGNWTISGINAEAFSGGGSEIGRALKIINESATNTVGLVGLAGTSGNQFAWSGTITIGRGESISLFYDRASTVWRLEGRVASGGTTPGGSDTQVQYNDGGALNGDSAMTFDETNDQLAVTNLQVSGAVNYAGDVAHTQTTGTVNNYNAGSSAAWQAGTVFKINPSTGTVSLTGLEAPTSPKLDGRKIVLVNSGTGGNVINLINNSGSSTNGNQFDMGGNMALGQGQSAEFIYSAAADGGNGGWHATSFHSPPAHDHSGATSGAKIPSTSVQTWYMSVPFSVIATANVTETTLPATPRFLRDSHRHVVAAPLAPFSEVMLVVNRQSVAAEAGSKMQLKYRSAFSTTVGDYLSIRDAGECEVTLSAGTDTVLTSGWVTMASGAKIDPAYLAIVTDDGDGVDSPTMGTIIAYFRTT